MNDKQKKWAIAVLVILAVFALGKIANDNAESEARARTAWNKRVMDAVEGHRVLIGMTAAQVIQAWGAPAEVNRTVTTNGSYEQWIYERRNGRVYLYVDNGVLHSFQDSR